MMTERESKLLASVLAAHNKMAAYEECARITRSNVDTVAMLLRENDSNGYLSEILRVSRQATVLTECAKEAHDALAAVLEVANG